MISLTQGKASVNRVGVVVPNIGQTAYVHSALRSIVKQTYPNWICVVVTDDPVCIEAIHEKWGMAGRVGAIFAENSIGVSQARNIGIAHLESAEFIVSLDADDIIAKRYFEKAVAILAGDPAVKVVDCRARYFGDKKGEMVLPSFDLDMLRRRNVVCTPAMFRKSDFHLVGGYDEAMERGLEDWEFWVAMLKDGGRVFRLNTVEYFYRQHKSSTSRRLSVGDWYDAKQYMKMKHPEFFSSWFPGNVG